MWLKGGPMLTRTGAYLFDQRQAKHLTRGQLAAALGYTNIAKGVSRIVHLERDGEAVAADADGGRLHDWAKESAD